MLLRHGYCLFVLYPHPSELSMSVENNIIDASRVFIWITNIPQTQYRTHYPQ
jgi:hypothetical protein